MSDDFDIDDIFNRMFDDINRMFGKGLNFGMGGPFHRYVLPPEPQQVVKDKKEIIPLDDRWILIEHLDTDEKESDIDTKIEKDNGNRFLILNNPISKFRRRFRLSPNMTGKYTWSIRHGVLQVDLYIAGGE